MVALVSSPERGCDHNASKCDAQLELWQAQSDQRITKSSFAVLAESNQPLRRRAFC